MALSIAALVVALVALLGVVVLAVRISQRPVARRTLADVLHEKRLTHTDLAFEMPKRFGTRTDSSTVSRWCTGQRPGSRSQRYIGEILEINPDDLWPA